MFFGLPSYEKKNIGKRRSNFLKYSMGHNGRILTIICMNTAFFDVYMSKSCVMLSKLHFSR